MTSPLAKLRTYNRPTNGLAWVREAERLLAEAYERPVGAATRGDAPLLPPGATEFESDGMRALRFTDTDGDLCEVRASARQEYQVKFRGQAGGWATLDSGCMSDGDPDSPAFPWLRSVWAEMREKERQPVSLKAARESALQAPSDAEERLAEERESDGDALAPMRYRIRVGENGFAVAEEESEMSGVIDAEAHEWCRAPAVEMERARTAAEIERLRARVGELETARDDWRECANRLTIRDIELTKGAVVDADRIASLRAERDAAIREREEAKARHSDLAENALRPAQARISELESQLAREQAENAELRDKLRRCRIRASVWKRGARDLRRLRIETVATCSEIVARVESQLAEVTSERDEQWSAKERDLYHENSELKHQLAEVRGMYEGLREMIDKMTPHHRQNVSGINGENRRSLRFFDEEAIAAVLTRFPALQPTESKEQEG